MELVKTQKSKTGNLIILGTSINSKAGANKVFKILMNIEDIEDVSIDLEDWENVLRVESQKPLPSEKVMDCVKFLGFSCYELPDY
jgi:hypothetical protein